MWRHIVGLLTLSAIAGLLWLRATWPSSYVPVQYQVPNAFVISLNRRTNARIPYYLDIPTTLVGAVNSSVAVQERVPLYVKHTMAHGRHDHMQISNAAMLGCYLSHVHVWETFLNSTDAVVAVFEEDVVVDWSSRAVLNELWHDMRGLNWSIVMLESGHLNTEGRWLYIGQHLATCAEPGTCTWFGTRGYLLTRQGAASLLRHARPIMVQVDALVSLVATWDSDFNMYWTRTDVAKQRLLSHSTVWDGCIKCYMPVALWPYFVLPVALITLCRFKV